MAELIYIGVLAAMDTFEGNNTNENPGAVQGTYDASVMQVVSVAMSDDFAAGFTYNDDNYYGPDTFTYDLGGGPITSGLDGEARFAAEVVRAGETVPESIQISVYQLQNGATFVRLPDGYKINQLTIQSMTADGFDAIYTDSSSTSTVVCFARGTWIETPDGPKRIEDLSRGDVVSTEDNGPQPVIWSAEWTVRSCEKTVPVHIAPNALGIGQPFAPLALSRQHRVFLRSPIAHRMFDAPGALVAAHRLVGLPGITLGPPGAWVDYVHNMCPQHELIRANGMIAETLLNAQVSQTVADDLCRGPLRTTSTDPIRPLVPAQRQKRYVDRIAARAARQGTPVSPAMV